MKTVVRLVLLAALSLCCTERLYGQMDNEDYRFDSNNANNSR